MEHEVAPTENKSSKTPQNKTVTIALVVIIVFLIGAFFLLLSVSRQINNIPQQQTNNVTVTTSPTEENINLIPSPPPGKGFVEGQVVVQFQDGVSDAVINEHLKQY